MQWEPVHTVTPAYPEIHKLLQRRIQDVAEGFRQNIALMGSPGMGKTSTVLGAIAATESPPVIIYCQLRHEPWKLWVQRMVASVLHGVAGFRVEPSIGANDLSQLLERAAVVAPDTAHRAAEILQHRSRGPQDRVFRQVLDLMRVACVELKRPGVIVLDEFQRLEDVGVFRPFHDLGKQIMMEQSILYVVTSSQPIHAQRILRERLNLLFGGFEVLTLRGIEAAAANAVVHGAMGDTRFADDFAQFLIWFADGHPWVLGTMGAAARMVDRSWGQIRTAHMLVELSRQLSEGRQPLALWCAERLHEIQHVRTSESYLALLSALAGHRSTVRVLAHVTKHTVHETSRQLSRLAEWGLVDRQGEVYIVDNPLWNFWFRHVYQPWRHAAHTTRDAIQQWTLHALEDTWQTYHSRLQQPAIHNFVDLLRRFQDELITIDNRRIRLPTYGHVTFERIGPSAYRIVAEPPSGAPWVYIVTESRLDEQAVSTFMQETKDTSKRLAQRIVVGLAGCDPAALLLAKASRVWAWEPATISDLERIYRFPALLTQE
jgi:hypothetical protein